MNADRQEEELLDQWAGAGGKPAKAFKISNGLSLRTRSVTQTATGEAGLWTTALAAAVLILES